MDSLLQFLLILFSTLLALLFSVYFYGLKRPTTGKARSFSSAPQSGGAWPIIGHMHLFGGKQLTHKILGAMADKAFSSRPSIAASKLLGYDLAMFGFAPYGPYWQVETAIRDLHKMWVSKGSAESGVTVDMKQWFGELTLNIVLRMVGGKRYVGPSADGEESESRRNQKVMRDFVCLFGVFVLSDAIPFLGWLDFNGYEKTMKRTAKELDILVGGWLEEHKQRRLLGGKEKQEQDFMDAMLKILEKANIAGFDGDTINKATCLNVILAGSDTTMVTLTWALSLLLNNPQVLKKAKDELDIHVGKDRLVDESDINNLIYLQAIIKETLRLYPASPLIALRSAKEDCTLSVGYHRSYCGTTNVRNYKTDMHRKP
ncbi:hypothetical protein POTOM_028074 [Populus tomentosa]|uniref:Uncharacterized protein n=1 Tax=Populus tomentosa TaxID=118781 RepID=A0A8X8CUL8_POPTO|nr:hypothetical protein POTOM_028074 [Populus tomentosa]